MFVLFVVLRRVLFIIFLELLIWFKSFVEYVLFDSIELLLFIKMVLLNLLIIALVVIFLFFLLDTFLEVLISLSFIYNILF